MKKIILLCLQSGCLMELSPARYQLIYELRKCGYQIYVYYPGNISDKNIRNQIFQAVNTRNLSTKAIKNKIKGMEPDYVIAFTYEDARILYNLPGKMKRTSFIYFNLEIYTPSMEQYVQLEGKFLRIRSWTSYVQNKIKEIIFVKQCKLFVIQDGLRRKVSAQYGIFHSNTLLIPNSYIFHKEDIIKDQPFGIIYSGGINKLQLESLMKELKSLPNLPITFSGWSDKWFREQYKKLRITHPDIKVYDQKISPEKFPEYLKQYAVGLIWYSQTKDENVNNIGMSSGKFFRHLSLGQPIIVNDCPGMGKIVEKYQLGIVIRDVSQLPWAYSQLMENYAYYRENIINVYKSKFDFAKLIHPFLIQLENL